MFDKIKSLGTDTAIYGVSTVVGRLLTFLLTPFYTNILPPSDLGIVATVYAYIAFLNILYGYGMESAFMRYTASLEIGTKKQVFSVPFFSVAATSLVFSLCIVGGGGSIATLISVPLDQASIITYSGCILLLDALAIIPFASLRMERKAKLFASLKLLNIVLTVVCNLIFLLVFRWGVEGIFLSNLIASAMTLLLLLPEILRNISAEWNAPLYKALLRFSIPTVPAYLATMMVQVIDRPILESLTDMATVGIYQANYRLGIFMMLIVSMFDFAWRPFFMSNANEADAKQMFSRVLTYFFLVMMGSFLVLSFFISDIVTVPICDGKSIIDPRYWGGLGIVPIVLLAYVFLGISNTIGAGVYIEKQTRKLSIVAFTGAAMNVLVNYLLIPPLGITGAAVATLASYASMSVVLYVIVQTIYPIRYEYSRLFKIAVASLAVYLLAQFVRADSFAILWKSALLILFVVLIYLMKFFDPSELARIARLLSRQSPGPGAGKL
ncbi:MAG: polysaccharide biosynthesis C-terminal domain-containing protein [Bacteroidetes bacterium]|nr:polysaccharide biosynthesis C-terminal domain-containing protein [Bacteroidota bacterium]MCW5895345.1 polysaccharide biosynthesis C-terminal domain-containing protein [Bacteroidota bacterium]